MSNGKFWMVQASGKNTYRARKRHATFEIAETEAKRLSQLNPGKPFFIMESVGCEYTPGPPPSAQNKKKVDTKVAVS